MLRIKYFEKFKGGNPFLVVIGDRIGFQSAHEFFQNKEGAFLNDSAVVEFCEIEPLDNGQLYLNAAECEKISELFEAMTIRNASGHAYFDTELLGTEIEGLISYLEYDDLF